MKTVTQRLCAASAAVLIAGAAQALTITIDPDDHTGNMTDVPFGAKLYSVRPNATYDDFSFAGVYSIAGGNWSPTGTRVFGTYSLLTGTSPHWDEMIQAGACLAGNGCSNFKVFGVYFNTTASSVKILTTMLGEASQDPVELWAMDVDGNVLRKCRQVGGVFALQTGVLPPPRLVGVPKLNGHVPTCGEVIEVKNCTGGPGSTNCDYVVEMRITRSQPDIGFVWFGGQVAGNSYAHVDRLTYSIPFPIQGL